jgi:hypothetical protein
LALLLRLELVKVRLHPEVELDRHHPAEAAPERALAADHQMAEEFHQPVAAPPERSR